MLAGKAYKFFDPTASALQGQHKCLPDCSLYIISILSQRFRDKNISPKFPLYPSKPSLEPSVCMNGGGVMHKNIVSWRGGFEPPIPGDEILHDHDISATQTTQNTTLVMTPSHVLLHQEDKFEHSHNTFLRKKCVICVSHIPEDLATIMRAWDSLPAAVKAGIVAMVNASRPQ
jgi:hypothetical protein